MTSPTSEPHVDLTSALDGAPLPAPPPTLASFLPDLLAPREPGAAGGVPLPDAWTCFRAVLGGVKRTHLEAEPNGSVVNTRAKKYGTHLVAGLHIVTGQTGGGKSAFVVNLANAAIAARHPVLYVSLELDGDELAARLLALRTGVPWWLLAQRRELDQHDQERARKGVDEISAEAALVSVLAPEGRLSMADVRAEALRLWRLHGAVPLVVFDYLQAPAAIAEAGGGRPPLREQIAATTMVLRRISRKMPEERGADGTSSWPGCPVVVLSVTARTNTAGEKPVPGLGKDTKPDDLRTADLETLKALPKEAGEIENTAVTAWVMALGEVDETRETRALCLRLAKSRVCAPGAWIPFTFDGATGALAEEPARYAEARGANGGGSTPPNGHAARTKAKGDMQPANGGGTPAPSDLLRGGRR